MPFLNKKEFLTKMEFSFHLEKECSSIKHMIALMHGDLLLQQKKQVNGDLLLQQKKQVKKK